MDFAKLNKLRYVIEQRKGQRNSLQKNIKNTEDNIDLIQTKIQDIEKARVIIQEVAQLTQKELEYHISELVSLALQAVFDDPYRFGVDFIIKRERTEAELYFERNGDRVHPISASGGGAVDIASMALRLSLWSLKNPRSRNTIILDEPFRFLSRDLQGRAADMLKQISERLGLQIIMVSHNPELIQAANKVFEVTIKNGISTITQPQSTVNLTAPKRSRRN